MYELIRYINLGLVAQIPVIGEVNPLSEPLIQSRMFPGGVSSAALYGQLSRRFERLHDGKDKLR